MLNTNRLADVTLRGHSGEFIYLFPRMLQRDQPIKDEVKKSARKNSKRLIHIPINPVGNTLM